jgi:hypothetical protein
MSNRLRSSRIRPQFWNGAHKLVTNNAGALYYLTVTVGDEPGPVFLHLYDAASIDQVTNDSLTPFATETLPPNYVTAVNAGPWQDFETGLVIRITDTFDASGSAPSNPVAICGRYQ